MAVLSAHGAAAYAAGEAAPESEQATGGSTGSEISEVIVTAQRRTESVQDVPITLQVLTAETITQLNVTTFDDFVKYLPNVTSGGTGPGQSDIYMRGLSFTLGGNGDGAAPTIFPNVAVYLDEQSGQLPGRNLDVYAADLERIEILEGPQGTLFGAGAEAGVVRYITNKPKLDVTEANVNAGYATTPAAIPAVMLTPRSICRSSRTRWPFVQLSTTNPGAATSTTSPEPSRGRPPTMWWSTTSVASFRRTAVRSTTLPRSAMRSIR